MEYDVANLECPCVHIEEKQNTRWACRSHSPITSQINAGNERPSMDFEDREAANHSQACSHVSDTTQGERTAGHERELRAQ